MKNRRFIWRGIIIAIPIIILGFLVAEVVYGQERGKPPVIDKPPVDVRPIPEHVLDKVPAEKRSAVESIANLRGEKDDELRKHAQREVAYLNRLTVKDMNPVWAEQEEVDEAEVESIIEASSDRLVEQVAPIPLLLTELDIDVLKLIDIKTLDLMLAELSLHEIRETFKPKFDEMTASEEMFWLLSSKRISIALTPDFAEMEVKPQARLTEFIAVDYDDAVAKGGTVAVLDGEEIDLLAFQRQVTDETRLIILNWTDNRLCNYFYKELELDDYKRIAQRIRSRRNMMNKLYPEIPTAVMIVIGRGDSDLLLLDLLDFGVDYLLLHGLSNPYAQWDAVARRYEKYGVKLIAGSVNEIRGLPTGGEEWQYIYDYMKQDDRYAGFLWRNPETPGGQKRVETHKR